MSYVLSGGLTEDHSSGYSLSKSSGATVRKAREVPGSIGVLLKQTNKQKKPCCQILEDSN